MDAVLYLHGKLGSAEEAGHYVPLFPSCAVIGIDYKASVPWKAGAEIREAITKWSASYDSITLMANSIGAYFSMCADIEEKITHAYFISPIVDMEKLIVDMMRWAGVTETDLRKQGIIHTDFGEDLSWEYLCYVREHPVSWTVPTDILCGSEDYLTSVAAVTTFAKNHHASLTVMDSGEHWFHTDGQMRFLDNWIRDKEAILHPKVPGSSAYHHLKGSSPRHGTPPQPSTQP